MPVMSRTAATVLAGLLLGAGGCSDDGADVGTEPEAADTGGTSSPDPLEIGLVEEVRALRETVAHAQALLRDAAQGDAGAAEEAVAALTADERLADRGTSVRPLFPGPLSSREETIDYGDALTSTLTAARGAGGPLGERVSQVLADPIAGDLGIWQRDAEGLLDAVDDAARSTAVDEAETAVLELPGEGTRALAYALLAARTDDEGDRAAYAERALAHLDIVLRAIDGALASTTEDP